jgi:hypothetical protein
MKRKKAQVEKASIGTVVGAKYRARCNELSDSAREKLNDEFMKLYYANSPGQRNKLLGKAALARTHSKTCRPSGRLP